MLSQAITSFIPLVITAQAAFCAARCASAAFAPVPVRQVVMPRYVTQSEHSA